MALDKATLAKVWDVIDDPAQPAERKRKATRVLEMHGALGASPEAPSDVPPKGYHEPIEKTGQLPPLEPDPEGRLGLLGGGTAHDLGRKRFPTTKELEGDPIAQGIVGSAQAAALGMPAGRLVGMVSPAIGKVVGGAIEGGAATAAQGGDTGDVLKGAALGTILSAPAAARAARASAAERVAGRMQTDITGGARGTAAKQVLAGKDALGELYDAHPELKKTMATGSTAEKANAVRAKLDELTEANDAATEAIAKHHGKISTDLPTARLQGLAERAEAAGDEILRDAVTSTLETIDSFAQNAAGTITAQQLRGIRNGLARTIAKRTGVAPDVARSSATAIKAELNDTIADLAGKTPGVDVEALKLRNKQIATLMPVQTQLLERAQAEGLTGPHDLAADLIEHPGKTVAKKVRDLRAKSDYSMANGMFGNQAPETALEGLPKGAARAAVAGGLGTSDDLSYAAKVAQGMKSGLSLQDAVKAANAQ